jgi:hypothetical protein
MKSVAACSVNEPSVRAGEAPIAAELDADRPIRIVELGFFGGGEIPIADDAEIRRSPVDNGTPVAFEIQPGGGPELPVAAEQPFALERRQ